MKTQELWLIRHGATEWYGTDRLHGQTDVPLGVLGLEQTQKLKTWLAPRGARCGFPGLVAPDQTRRRLHARWRHPVRRLAADRRPGSARLDYTSFTRLTRLGEESVLEVFGDAVHLEEV